VKEPGGIRSPLSWSGVTISPPVAINDVGQRLGFEDYLKPSTTDMIHEIWKWIEFNSWFGLICLAIGLLAAPPLLLTKTSRKRFLRSGYEIETIGAVVLIVAIVLIGLYNHLGAHGT